MAARIQDSFEPSSVIRDDNDATIILVLWCVRKSFFPLLWLGLSVATVFYVLVGRDVILIEEQVSSLTSPAQAARAFLSPFVLVAVAFLLRLSVGFLALIAAYPLSRSTTSDDHADVGWVGRHARVGKDRLYLSRAFRSLRWTWIVRRAAVDRLGRRGQLLAMCNPVLRWAGIVLFILFIVITVLALSAQV